MARKLHPPQYDVSEPAVFIDPSDDAWKHDQLEEEKVDGYLPDEHPVARYLTGQSRYRLTEVEPYLDRTKKPEEWTLREPPTDVWYRVRRTLSQFWSTAEQDEASAEGYYEQAFLEAFRWGIEKVEPDPVGIRRTPAGELTEETVRKIRKMDPTLPVALGRAVWVASQPMTEAEGKP